MERGILLVDDEEHILNAMGRELRPWFEARGLSCFQARSGSEALEFLQARHRRVLVMVSDLKMPGMSGDELVTRVKGLWPAIETILISGYAEMKGLSRAVAAGIRGFVPKPWETSNLTAELDKALDERERRRKEDVVQNHLTYQLTRTREVQKTLFRNDALDPSRFRMSLLYRPLAEQFCGGDFYEIVSLSRDRCVVLLGDVSGHGAEAAFLTGILHTLITQDEIYNLLAGSATPGSLLVRLNRLVFDHLNANDARTVALTVLLADHETGTVQISSAGGLPIVRVRQGEGLPIHVQGFPLGLAAETDYPVQTMETRAGDRWMVMTDGLVDRGQAGFLSGSDVVRLVAQGPGAGPEAPRLETVIEAFQAQFDRKTFLDDLTLACLEVV